MFTISHPSPPPSPFTSCISMGQLPDKSDRILQKAPEGLIITINITSLSSHRPFFRRPSRLASLIVMTTLFFPLSYGTNEAQWLSWGHPAGWGPYQKFPYCLVNQWCCRMQLHRSQQKYVSGFYKGLFNKTIKSISVPCHFSCLCFIISVGSTKLK